ncbi:hypothetical protein Poli38472_012975 [Pythium oligandrum]|uniref:COG4 transport protein middle alpha-helical bundle domain-containing protein n=1 Tax=Pythium oligandrum TaxID=41045 RepID=A0A8K1CK02_PYTOL|nr:hypothetical protein Poli38472_012975 [Pythium oligandrum]|eukprot:TMW64353.1 hypothetical protein Poli38472_012975 [Pythium oligandrum]
MATTTSMSGFEENMTAFYMAFAEDKLEAMCQSLSNMRLVVQNDHAEQQTDDETAVRAELLRACEMKAESVQDKVVAQLKAACASGDDIDHALTCFYLCVELGAASQAVGSFTGCLSRIFKTQSRAVFDRVCAFKTTAPVNEHGYIERNFYVEAMSELMTGATDLMNAVADVTTDPLVVQKVLSPIHETCTEVVMEIVHMYAEDARMMAWERRAMDQARRDPSSGTSESDVESDESLQMVDLFLDELSFIIRILMSYSAFVQSIAKDLDGQQPSAFAVKIQEFNGVYLVLERFYVFQSVHKATAIAEVQELEPNVYVSSIVEDVSFVLNKAFFRASQCMNYHTSLSIVIAIVDALDSQYLPSIINLPSRAFVLPQSAAQTAAKPTSLSDDESSGSQDVSFSDMLLAAVDDDLTRAAKDDAKLIMAINSSFMSGEFVESLASKIDEYSSTTFPHEAPINECLPKPISELTDAFRSIVEHEIQNMLSQNIRMRMEPLINRTFLERIDYVLTSAQYDAFGLHGSPLNKLIQLDVMQNPVLRRYEQALITSPFEALISSFVEDLTKWIEAALVRFRKTCNDLGALQLEREVTDTLQRVSEFVKETSLRAAFTRLFQIVLILNLMQPMDIVDYGESITNEFTTREIETFLRMRVDFKPDDIQRAIRKLEEAGARCQ